MAIKVSTLFSERRGGRNVQKLPEATKNVALSSSNVYLGPLAPSACVARLALDRLDELVERVARVRRQRALPRRPVFGRRDRLAELVGFLGATLATFGEESLHVARLLVAVAGVEKGNVRIASTTGPDRQGPRAIGTHRGLDGSMA